MINAGNTGGRRAVMVCAAFVIALPARAQWAVTVLHSGSAGESVANGFDGSVAYGEMNPLSARRAARFEGGSWIDLTPGLATSASILGADAGLQVGYVQFPGFADRAAMWTGTAESFVDLTPPLYFGSRVLAARDGWQAGYAAPFDVGHEHAGYWHLTAESWVDLHPPGMDYSRAQGIGQGQQVGSTVIHNTWHAALWTGSAESWVDLHPTANVPPAGARHSNAYAVHEGQQVGAVYAPGTFAWAAVWTGSADSFINLSPPGTIWSEAFSVYAGRQAGKIVVGTESRACVWSGTAASIEDLSLVLPPDYYQSGATSVWTDGQTLFVTGLAVTHSTGRTHALLWTRPLVGPCYANCDGSTRVPVLNVLDFNCFLNAYTSGAAYANCDQSTAAPVLNVLDFTCFLNRFAAGCP
jgi:hypothetical protein